MLVGENVGLVREDIKFVEEECWVGGGGCFGEDVVGIADMECWVWDLGYRNWFSVASAESPSMHSLGSERSEPLRARGGRPSAGARIWACRAKKF